LEKLAGHAEDLYLMGDGCLGDELKPMFKDMNDWMGIVSGLIC
jgi:hypothetical protein